MICNPHGKLEDLAGSEIVLITAGTHRKEGMERSDLAFINADIVS